MDIVREIWEERRGLDGDIIGGELSQKEERRRGGFYTERDYFYTNNETIPI